jgi:hypothetical protein
MSEPIVVEMMTREALLWRCLHGGPLTANSLEEAGPDGNVPFAVFRARNLRLLENLTDTYGACAVAARMGEAFVGHLRFYPQAVREMAAPGQGLCMQQEFPGGPPDDLGSRAFPRIEEIGDRTLLVHCMMVAAEGPEGWALRRQGIGTRLARALIDWAATNGWRAIEATAYASLPIIYTISGQAGRGFWESLGFRLLRTEREPLLEKENDFVRKMRQEALGLGLDPASIANKYVMRLDLSGRTSS